jgi:LacI family transcriptional regulator
MPRLVHIEVVTGAQAPLNARLLEGLLRFGRERPHWRIAVRAPHPAQSVRALRARGTDGAILITESVEARRPFSRLGRPRVHVLGRPGPSRRPHASVNDDAIGRLGAETLAEMGFERLAYLGPGSHWDIARRRGFIAELAERGPTCRWAEMGYDGDTVAEQAEGTKGALAGWLRSLETPVAVMCGHDQIASRVADACLQTGLAVPEHVAILGVGNHELICELSGVGLSSIDPGLIPLARLAAEALEGMLTGSPPPAKPLVVSPAGVVRRRSTEALAIADSALAQAVSYIRDHACDGATVADVLRAVHVSQRTLERKFARHRGRTPSEEIRIVRLRHARTLLMRTAMPLVDVALRAGFADISHLSREFKRSFGISPGAYRRRGPGTMDRFS